MRARMAVAANIVDLPQLPAPMANLIHRTILDSVNVHGRLVFGSEAELLALIRAVRSVEGVPQDARKRWLEVLAELRKQNRIHVLPGEVTPLAEVQRLEDLRAQWAELADVAVVGSASCAALGIPADIGMAVQPGRTPEVAGPTTVGDVPWLASLRDLAATGHVSHGSDRNEFWGKVLEPLAADARSVTVLDGYLFTGLTRAHTEQARRRAVGHIPWLLERLDSVMAPGSQVMMVANGARHRPLDAATISRILGDIWKPSRSGRLASVTVELIEPAGAARFPHDRHIRFSTGSAVKVLAGMDRLRERSIWDPDGMNWEFVWAPKALQTLRDTEKRALSLPAGSSANLLSRR